MLMFAFPSPPATQTDRPPRTYTFQLIVSVMYRLPSIIVPDVNNKLPNTFGTSFSVLPPGESLWIACQ